MEIFHGILSVSENIIVDLNNVMLTFLHISFINIVIKLSSIHTYSMFNPKLRNHRKVN